MTKIEWVKNQDGSRGATWNPITGCSKTSPGCQHCYAEEMSRRLKAMGQEKYQDVINGRGWTGEVRFWPDVLDEPLKRKKPQTYFVCSMSDLFHKEVLRHNWVMRIWEVMAKTPQHTYQILTKRPDFMEETVGLLVKEFGILPNVWLGTSVENQEAADKRIPFLLRTPATVRFLSCEPLLGPIDLHSSWAIGGQICHKCETFAWYDQDDTRCPNCRQQSTTTHLKIDWVIIGGESGPRARSMNPDWVYGIRDQCIAAKTPFFFKQWGRFAPTYHSAPTGTKCRFFHKDGCKAPNNMPFNQIEDGFMMWELGKKRAGRLLDGQEWNQMPEVSR